MIMIVDCTDLVFRVKAPDHAHSTTCTTWLQAVQLFAELADFDEVIACGGTGRSVCAALVSSACARHTWTLDLLPQLAVLCGVFLQ